MSTESILKLLGNILFPDSSSESENDTDVNLEPDQLAYLSRLGSLGLESLNGEVSRLNEELAILDHQTKDLASQNYQIFVQSAQSTNLIKNSIKDASEKVLKLSEESFPDLKSSLSTFKNESLIKLEAEKANIEILFEKENEITKILEMQWVIRKFLAEENLSEAIKVLQAAQEITKNVPQPPPLLLQTCNEVTKLKSEIQNALLSKLGTGTIGLSECLQTITLLRNFFPDDKTLRFRFLQSRYKDINFEEGRSWMFDTLTQHRAAFGADLNHYLSTWVYIHVEKVLHELEKEIDSTDAIDSLLLQASYFGESLSRVGADVRGLIIPIFTEHLVKKVDHSLTQHEIKFHRNLHQFVLTLHTNLESLEFSESVQDLDPPKQLITYTPLAIYLNDVLSLLNIVGKCFLVQSGPQIVNKIQGSLNRVGNELEIWARAEWATWEIGERNEFTRMKRYFTQLLIPHLDKVIKVIFSPIEISYLTGLNIGQCVELIGVKFIESENNLSS